MSYENSSLDRALNIIEVVRLHPGLRLKDLSELVGANQTTVLRTARVLERHGLIRRDHPGLSYHLGTRLVELGNAAAKGLDAVASLRPIAERLSAQHGVTAHIGLLYDGMVTVVDKVDPRELLVRYSSLGTRMPLHATAAGKAVLAMVGPERMGEVGVREPLLPYGPNSISDLGVLSADITAARGRGYSIEREEYQAGFSCVGTAVSISDEIYAISLSGPTSTDGVLEDRGTSLREAASSYVREHQGVARGLRSDEAAGHTHPVG
ncbi:MAG TPA: IclR family transcriptional regulator [Pseudolysinimonas sp.]|nr:IclR family transcriptional regulator [Pseudolysinimonas sp.]